MPKYVSNNRHFNVNEVQTDAHLHILSFCDLMDDANWTFIESSNGTTVSSIIRNDITRWSNNNAWEHWRDPGARDLVIQRGTSQQSWRGYVGQKNIPFTGGTSTVAPTDVNTRLQIIGGSDNFNTNFFPFTVTSTRVHMMVDSIGRGPDGDIYEFWTGGFSTTGGSLNACTMWRFPVISPSDGSVGDADAEPWVVNNSSAFSTSAAGWYKAGLTGASRRTNISFGVFQSVTWGVDPYSGEYYLGPYLAWESGTNYQIKGFVVDLHPVLVSTADNDTVNLAIEGRSMFRPTGNALIPWPHGVTPVVT